MVETDKQRFAQLLVTTAELFEKDLSSPIIKLYFKAFKNFSINHIEDALSKVVVSCKFFPKPVEIIELISDGPGRIEDTAQLQADLVIGAIKKIGAYQSVEFDDPVTTIVILNCFGGWGKMCQELLELSEKWFRKDFISYYQTYFRRGIGKTGGLPGLIESDNQMRGYLKFIPEPIKIDGFDRLKIELTPKHG